VYLLLLGALNSFRRPFLVSGTRDVATLGLAVSGLVLVGPIELFMPVAATIAFGAYVWALLIGLYALGLVLVLLLSRPRLVIYNISPDELRPILADLVSKLDEDARWAGDSLFLPHLGVQLYMDGPLSMRNLSLLSNGPKQSHAGWRRLELALKTALADLEVPRNPRGLSLISAGCLISLGLAMAVSQDPHTVAQSLSNIGQSVRQMLHL
jgi:hypothetical protein